LWIGRGSKEAAHTEAASLPPGNQRKLCPFIGDAKPKLPIFFITGRVSHLPSFHGLSAQLFAIQFHGKAAAN
jgi:hypothetical protein